MTYRVIQFATGECGQVAVRAIAEHPQLELVGARVYSPAKVGRDVGELCGTRPLGIVATDDEEALLALDADCVLWMGEATMFGPGAGPESGVDELCRILRSGKNVITIVHMFLLHPPSLPAAVRDPIERACEEGGVSLHATGIDPGFNAEVLGLLLSGLCSRIDELRAREILDYGMHNNRQILFDVLGFGGPPEWESPIFGPSMQATYGACLRLMADGLGVRLDDVRFVREVAVAPESYEVPAGWIEAGTVSGIRFQFDGLIAGEPRLVIEHVTRLGADQAPDWPQGHGYSVLVRGEPSLHLELELGEAGDRDPLYYTKTQHVAVPMRAVHSIPAICRAAPGIRSLLELPMIPGGFTLAASA